MALILALFPTTYQEAEEEALRRQAKPNWAATASAGVNSQKTLAEIQAEESRLDRQRQEKERQERTARQKEMGLAQASVWGSASANLSWAGKASSNGASGNNRYLGTIAIIFIFDTAIDAVSTFHSDHLLTISLLQERRWRLLG